MGPLLLALLVLAASLRLCTTRIGGGENAETVEDRVFRSYARRLEQEYARHLKWESHGAAFLMERGQLPLMRLGSLKLNEVVMFHKQTPNTIRHIKITDSDHETYLQRGDPMAAARRLGLEDVVNTEAIFMTPRDRVRILLALSAAMPTREMYTQEQARRYNWDTWGGNTYIDGSNWILDCVNRTKWEEDMNATVESFPPDYDFPEFCRVLTTTTTTSTTLAQENKKSLFSKSEVFKTTTTRGGVIETWVNNSRSWGTMVREMNYLQTVRDNMRFSLKNSSADGNPQYEDMFLGLRSDRCMDADSNPKADKQRCIDDVGFAMSVYQDKLQKVLVFHGGFTDEKDYVRWALKTDIILNMEALLSDLWLNSVGAEATIDMKRIDGTAGRFGLYEEDEKATRCAFFQFPFQPWQHEAEFLKSLNMESRAKEARSLGLWFVVKQMIRRILPENRNMKVEKKQDLYFTGSGLGGTFAAFSSMWLEVAEAAIYPTMIFAPVGFSCLGRTYSGDFSSWTEHAQITTYTHPFDPIAFLGRLQGTVCLVGKRNMTKGTKLYSACGRTVGHTGPQLMCSEDCARKVTRRYPLDPDADIWGKYLITVLEGREALRTCLYYTHNVWYLAHLMSDQGNLYLDGKTEGGCMNIKAVERKDPLGQCPREVWVDCWTFLQVAPPVPYGLIGFLMLIAAIVITILGVILFTIMLNIKNDRWIYGNDLVKYADDRGVLDWQAMLGRYYERLCPKRKRRHDKKIGQDRAQEARYRAIHFKLEGHTKQILREQFGHKAVKEMEMKRFLLGKNGVEEERYDLYIAIISATKLKNADVDGLSDPCCLVQIPGKRDSRFVTPVIPNNLNPVWNYQMFMPLYQEDDDIEVSIWDMDNQSDNPEEGDFLGKVLIAGGSFWPRGFPPREFRLGLSKSLVTIRIVVQKQGLPPPPLEARPHGLVDLENDMDGDEGDTMKDKSDKKDKKHKKEKEGKEKGEKDKDKKDKKEKKDKDEKGEKDKVKKEKKR